jgi:hypothetical protein
VQVRGLHGQGKIPWQNHCNVHARCVLNVDEVGSDTKKRRWKAIADKRDIFRRISNVTSEGDRMMGHVAARIAARADGEFC